MRHSPKRLERRRVSLGFYFFRTPSTPLEIVPGKLFRFDNVFFMKLLYETQWFFHSLLSHLWCLFHQKTFVSFLFSFSWIYLDALSNVNQFHFSDFLSGLRTGHHKGYYLEGRSCQAVAKMLLFWSPGPRFKVTQFFCSRKISKQEKIRVQIQTHQTEKQGSP